MSKEVIITNYKNQYLVVSLDNGKAVEMFLKAPDALKIGDIFVGKVKNIVNNIQAAFVEIQPGVIGYYSLKSNPNHIFSRPSNGKLKNGDEILVQVERGSIKRRCSQVKSSFPEGIWFFLEISNLSAFQKRLMPSGVGMP